MAGREETTEVTGMLMRRRRWGRKNSRRTAGGQGSVPTSAGATGRCEPGTRTGEVNVVCRSEGRM